MKEIFLHEYTFTPWKENPIGSPIKSVTVLIESEDEEESSLLATGFVNDFFEQNLNVEHKLVLRGYRDE